MVSCKVGEWFGEDVSSEADVMGWFQECGGLKAGWRRGFSMRGRLHGDRPWMGAGLWRFPCRRRRVGSSVLVVVRWSGQKIQISGGASPVRKWQFSLLAGVGSRERRKGCAPLRPLLLGLLLHVSALCNHVKADIRTQCNPPSFTLYCHFYY